MADKARQELIQAFLDGAGWGAAVRVPVTGDASARRYERLTLGDEKTVFVDTPGLAEGHICPKGANEHERKALGYTASARLAGTNPSAFICLASALTRRGFSAPQILASDLENGLLLIEDLGADRVAETVAAKPELEAEIYQAAISLLAALYRSSFMPDLSAHHTDWHVGKYDTLALQTEADLFPLWYVPHFDGKLSDAVLGEWHQIWERSFARLDAHAHGLALRDFHAENTFYLPARAGRANIGLIDFQDALFAHPAYDLVSLLEDARRDVSLDLIAPLIEQFCAEAGIENDEKFSAAYAAQGAQRNAKILGIFVRLNTRDDKPHYLDLIPRVAAHFRNDLSHPAMADLKAWTQQYTPSLWESGP